LISLVRNVQHEEDDTSKLEGLGRGIRKFLILPQWRRLGAGPGRRVKFLAERRNF
jgi:hypothetical protein